MQDSDHIGKNKDIHYFFKESDVAVVEFNNQGRSKVVGLSCQRIQEFIQQRLWFTKHQTMRRQVIKKKIISIIWKISIKSIIKTNCMHVAGYKKQQK